MTDPTQFLEQLDAVHRRTRRLIACVPAEHAEWAPAAGRFTIGEIVRHLAGIERWMYAETVHGRPTRYPGHGRELAEGWEATISYYDRLHAESRALFAALDEAAMRRKAVTPAGAAITTWKWLRLMLEHEAHHRGQLYLMLGLLGVPTPPIYGLTAEEVQARSLPERARAGG